MEESVLSSVVLPLSLFIIMLGMGLSLVMDDFRRVVRMPRAAMVGFFNQLVLLPVLGFGLCLAFDLKPEYAVGLMILAACPGGVTSNLITHVSKGDLALSISLTAVASVITVFTIPIVTSFSIGYFMNSDVLVELPIGVTMGKIFGITVLPVVIGMVIRRLAPEFAKSMDRPMRIASTVIFTAVVLGLVVSQREILGSSFAAVGLVTLTLNVVTMGIGFFSARALRLELPQALAITIESGIQNGTLAITVAVSILHNSAMGIPPAVYSLLMFVTGAVIMMTFGRRKEAPRPT